MTSISGYSIYTTKCCNQEVSLPNYASIGSNYIKQAEAYCHCKVLIEKSNLKLIGIDKRNPPPLCDGGVDNYEIPYFLKKI